MLELSALTLLAATPCALFARDEATGNAGWTEGELQLESIGELAFGPDGVLFVADPLGGRVVALKLGEEAGVAEASFLVDGADVQIASMLGTVPSDILIEDLAANPESGDVYLSITRGRGEGSVPVLIQVSDAGGFEEVALDDVLWSAQDLASPPEHRPDDRRNPRTMSITDLQFVDGRLYVAGLSNEEFASRLRTYAFPFDGAEEEASVEIYHGNHGAWETHAPVRTFLPYEIKGEQHLVAAYTCTPLVTFSVDELKPGSKVRGKTVAELGGGNAPLDMIVYEKDGKEFLLIANNRRGVMKMSTVGLTDASSITERVYGLGGLEYETIDELEGIEHMAPLTDEMAVVILRDPISSSTMLATIEMP